MSPRRADWAEKCPRIPSAIFVSFPLLMDYEEMQVQSWWFRVTSSKASGGRCLGPGLPGLGELRRPTEPMEPVPQHVGNLVKDGERAGNDGSFFDVAAGSCSFFLVAVVLDKGFCSGAREVRA